MNELKLLPINFAVVIILIITIITCGTIFSIFDGDDGEILYITSDYGGLKLCIYRTNDKKIRVLNFNIAPEQNVYRARWSPDKKYIAVQMKPSNMVDGPQSTYIFDHYGNLMSKWGITVSNMCWSADGRKIAYNISNASASSMNAWDYAYIYVANIDGSDSLQVLQSIDNFDISRDWFKDGKSLLISNRIRKTHPVDQKTHTFEYIYKLEIATGELNLIYKKLTAASEYRVSPDGSKIAFIDRDITQDTDGSIRSSISVAVLDIESKSIITSAPLPSQSAGIYGPIWSPEGDKILIAKKKSSGGEHNAEMFYFDLHKKEFVNILKTNRKNIYYHPLDWK